MFAKSRKARLLAAALSVTAVLLPSVAAAWKPTSHVYFAEIAVNDALDDGYVEIPVLGTGEVRRYKVADDTLMALRPVGRSIAPACLGRTPILTSSRANRSSIRTARKAASRTARTPGSSTSGTASATIRCNAPSAWAS